MSDEKLSPLTKRIMVAGIILIAALGMFQDITIGKDLALIVVGGIIGMLNGDK